MPRPKSFDPDVALDRAMGVFWEKGYESASVQDLTTRMGINRFSLYDTFGDKRSLFLAALDRYVEGVMGEVLGAIASPEATLEDLERWLIHAAEPCEEEGARCCMMLRCAIEMAPDDEEAAARVSAAKERVRGCFERILERGRASGEVRAGVDPAAAAWGLYAFHAGLAAGAGGPVSEMVRLQINALRA